MKLIVEILNEEIKSLKQLSPMDYSTDCSCMTAKSSKFCVRTTTQPPIERHYTCVHPATNTYAVPVANRYAPLTNCCKQQVFNDGISTTTMKWPPDFPSISNYQSIKGSRRNKTLPSQPSLPGNQQLVKPHPQTPKENEDGPLFIPAIINSVTSVIYNANMDHKRSVSVDSSIKQNSPLQTKVKLNTSKNSVMPACRRRIKLIIGDSHARGLPEKISNFLYRVWRYKTECWYTSNNIPTAPQIWETNKKRPYGGTKDISRNEINKGVCYLKGFAHRTLNTNIILLGAPHRYDLPSFSCVNTEVKLYNKRLQGLMSTFNHVRVLSMPTEGSHHTNHGLHLNKKGKDWIVNNLVNPGEVARGIFRPHKNSSFSSWHISWNYNQTIHITFATFLPLT